MKHLKSIFVLAICLIVCSCGSLLKVKVIPQTVELSCSAHPQNRYTDMSHGLYLNVTSDVENTKIYDTSELPSKTAKLVNNAFTFTPTITEFVKASMSTYIRSMGITLGRDRDNDYTLNVRVREFKILDGTSSARVTVILDYSLKNNDNETILQETARGRYIMSRGQSAADALDKAYSKALAEMDWDGIAGYLQVHRRADQEAQRKVQGDGDTALEHTVIRWYIASTPAGADVSWRVISSTPDVKNTNSTYVGTTPYETTESFDIRGLKFENSGNVQIEVTCEKAGYLPQKKRFNLRQAIEQKEISAKFNLVKDE
ncbi:MAG: hypothetical protein K2K00_06315 [Muribaculaceae bacterium]|nr:hypothetical protein [Muribaculaceae bacterium]